MLLIGNDSRVQAAIAAELEQVFAGEEDDCEITTEHCRQMKYLEMAIKEALRIFPSGKYLSVYYLGASLNLSLFPLSPIGSTESRSRLYREWTRHSSRLYCNHLHPSPS